MTSLTLTTGATCHVQCVHYQPTFLNILSGVTVSSRKINSFLHYASNHS